MAPRESVRSERAEVARKGVKAFNERDLATVLEFVDEDVEWLPLRSAIEGPYYGHDGFRKWWADTAASWEVFEIEMHEYRDVGDDRFIARGVIHAKGRGGEVPLEIPTSWAGQWRGLRIARTEFFFDELGAPRAVGLASW